MSSQGAGQILVYPGALLVLAYPLGPWMTRVYGRLPGAGPARRRRARLLPARRNRPGEEQDWSGYALPVLVFSAVCTVLLYVILRVQGHLPLNPDGMKAMPPHLALNTAASFVTNTSWQFYGGESTLSYLSQMAGIAVQMFVSAGVGMAVLAAVVRGFSRRSRSELGNFWVDLYRSLVYVLLPLSLVLARDPRLAGRAADVQRTRDGDHARKARRRRSRAGPSPRRRRSRTSRWTAAASTTRTRRPRSRTRPGSRTSSRCSRCS